MNNGLINGASHFSDPMATGPDHSRFLAAQAGMCVDALWRARAAFGPIDSDSRSHQLGKEDSPQLEFPELAVTRSALTDVAVAIAGVVYDYEPNTGCVERVGNVRDAFGYSEDVMQLSLAWWRSLIHPEDRVRVQSLYQHAVATGMQRLIVEYRMRHAGGHYVDVLDRAALIHNASGAVVRVIGCIEDVTELRRADQALRETERRKDELLTIFAHELRNPMMPIRCALEVIDRAKGNALAVERSYAIIKRQFGQMVRLLDNMLDVSSIACGSIVLHKERIDLHGVLKSAVEAVQPLIDARQHELELLSPLTPVLVHADEARLTQIVTNLLSNAIKYTPDGGRICVAASLEPQRGEVEIRVRDTGIGIPATELERIFEIFARVEDQHHPQVGGLGIGLAVSRDLAASHGGCITAHSDGPGHGSEFVFTLPIDADAQAGVAAQVTDKEAVPL